MKDFLRRHVLHNFSLKVIALVLAVALWRAVGHDPVAEVAVDVPVEFHNIPGNLEINSESVPRAQIWVRGPERLVRGLERGDIYTAIELSGVNPGERTFDLTADQIHKPSGLEVVQIVPSQLHISFDVRVTRAVPVRPRVVGDFAPGLEVGRVLVEPSTVMVSGPKGRVEGVEAAITDVIDASGTMDRASFTRHAYVSDPLVQVVNPGTVQVTVIMDNKPAGTRRR